MDHKILLLSIFSSFFLQILVSFAPEREREREREREKERERERERGGERVKLTSTAPFDWQDCVNLSQD